MEVALRARTADLRFTVALEARPQDRWPPAAGREPCGPGGRAGDDEEPPRLIALLSS